MSILDIRLLGRFQVLRDGEPMPGFEVGKVKELFSYLLMNRRRSHLREILATLLWVDNDASQARRYLSKALWQLQSALLETGTAGAGSMLLCESEWIQFNAQGTYRLDVADFEEAVSQANGVPGCSLDADVAQALRGALDCYQGDFLEGCYEDWCLCERQRLQCLYLITLDRLMHYYEAQGEYEAGQACGFRILSCDQARERTHRQLMRLHYLAGDRTGALRQYERCKTVLQEELGVPPSHLTQLLYEQICSDKPLVEPAVQAPDALPMVEPLQQLLVEVRRLQATASEVEQYLQQQVTPNNS